MPTETRVENPAATAFCTISNEQRLVIRQKPSTRTPAAKQGADQLIEGIMPADILAHGAIMFRRA